MRIAAARGKRKRSTRSTSGARTYAMISAKMKGSKISRTQTSSVVITTPLTVRNTTRGRVQPPLPPRVDGGSLTLTGTVTNTRGRSRYRSALVVRARGRGRHRGRRRLDVAELLFDQVAQGRTLTGRLTLQHLDVLRF